MSNPFFTTSHQQIFALRNKDGRNAIVLASSPEESRQLAEHWEHCRGGWLDAEVSIWGTVRERRTSRPLALERRRVETIYLVSQSGGMEGLLVGFATDLNELHKLVRNDYTAKTGHMNVGTRLDLDNKMVYVWHTPASETAYYYFSLPRVA